MKVRPGAGTVIRTSSASRHRSSNGSGASWRDWRTVTACLGRGSQINVVLSAPALSEAACFLAHAQGLPQGWCTCWMSRSLIVEHTAAAGSGDTPAPSSQTGAASVSQTLEHGYNASIHAATAVFTSSLRSSMTQCPVPVHASTFDLGSENHGRMRRAWAGSRHKW